MFNKICSKIAVNIICMFFVIYKKCFLEWSVYTTTYYLFNKKFNIVVLAIIILTKCGLLLQTKTEITLQKLTFAYN